LSETGRERTRRRASKQARETRDIARANNHVPKLDGKSKRRRTHGIDANKASLDRVLEHVLDLGMHVSVGVEDPTAGNLFPGVVIIADTHRVALDPPASITASLRH